MPLTIRVQVDKLGKSDDAPGRTTLALVRRAVRAALMAERVPDAEISVTLLRDAAVAKLNRQWLGHEGATDVLSFPLYDDGEPPVGDVYIGIDQARRQARELGVALREELARLAIHGTLHVLGYDHPAGPKRVKSEMWRRQERVLARVLGP
jgi:probable rRNA maturation factor